LEGQTAAVKILSDHLHGCKKFFFVSVISETDSRRVAENQIFILNLKLINLLSADVSIAQWKMVGGRVN
jgi:hypothetical protein